MRSFAFFCLNPNSFISVVAQAAERIEGLEASQAHPDMPLAQEAADVLGDSPEQVGPFPTENSTNL